VRIIAQLNLYNTLTITLHVVDVGDAIKRLNSGHHCCADENFTAEHLDMWSASDRVQSRHGSVSSNNRTVEQ